MKYESPSIGDDIGRLMPGDQDFELTMNHERATTGSVNGSIVSGARSVNAERFIWRSGCFELDSRAVQFMAKFIVSAGALMFCAYQMAMLTPCESQNYRDIFTLIIGVWVESPRIASSRSEGSSTIATKRETERFLWRSCCFELDSRAVQFLAKFIVSVGALVFCTYQSVGRGPCETQIYSSIFALIIGTWIDAPRINK